MPDLTGFDSQGLRFVLSSLSSEYALVFDLPTKAKAIAGSRRVDLTVSASQAALDVGSPVPVLVHFKRRHLNLPEYMIWGLSSSEGMRVRELKQYAEYVTAMYQLIGFSGIWSALERIWCELQLRQRPLTRPLTPIRVEARIRSLAGNTVWVEHTGGIAIGRCPNIGEFFDAGILEMRTATGTVTVPSDSILEIGPWGSGYGSSFVTSPSSR